MKYFVVDTFTTTLFSGNPTGVCVLEQALDDATKQKIAEENRLSETAFLQKQQNGYRIQWFTPKAEVDLCAHATIGAAYVVTHFLEPDAQQAHFVSKKETLLVERNNEEYTISLSEMGLQPIPLRQEMEEALGVVPLETYLSRDLLFILDDEKTVQTLQPDFEKLRQLPEGLGVIVTAIGTEYDCISRCFFPKLGVNEDMATGSSHAILIPYWAKHCQKKEFTALQYSARKGILHCKYDHHKVKISGTGTLYLTGEIHLPKL